MDAGYLLKCGRQGRRVGKVRQDLLNVADAILNNEVGKDKESKLFLVILQIIDREAIVDIRICATGD
jgi:hypothetical protein